MKISDVRILSVHDSRGEETLRAEIIAFNACFSASVPSGKSKGSYEAASVPFSEAQKNLSQIKQRIIGKEFSSQREFDWGLIFLDGTGKKTKMGGNLLLSLSLAFSRARAYEEGKPLYKFLSDSFGGLLGVSMALPRLIFNMINGGAHGKFSDSWKNASVRKLDFQEFQVIPEGISDMGVAVSIGREFYQRLREVLRKKFSGEVVLGDEAGFSCPFSSNEEALEILSDIIEKHHYPLRLGVDVAASQFYKEGKYHFGGKIYGREGIREHFASFVKKYCLISIEDPFHEDDFDSFAKFTADLNESGTQSNAGKKSNVLVIADDLTATDLGRTHKATQRKSGNAIIIKPNQAGTVWEAFQAAAMARRNGWEIIVSHRSGETEDDFIADLSVALGSWGIKAGAPETSFRMRKYNRLIRIQEEMKSAD